MLQNSHIYEHEITSEWMHSDTQHGNYLKSGPSCQSVRSLHGCQVSGMRSSARALRRSRAPYSRREAAVFIIHRSPCATELRAITPADSAALQRPPRTSLWLKDVAP